MNEDGDEDAAMIYRQLAESFEEENLDGEGSD